MFQKHKLNFYLYLSIALAAILVVIVVLWLSRTAGSQKPVTEVAEGPVQLFQNEHSQESTALVLKKYYGLEPEMYDEAVLYFPITNMDAEELLILKLADPSQAEAAAAAIQERNQSQINVYEGYAPEQYALCEDAVIDVQGHYILYVVHKDADRIDAAFREAL